MREENRYIKKWFYFIVMKMLKMNTVKIQFMQLEIVLKKNSKDLR
jgi:hypothetical protein